MDAAEKPTTTGPLIPADSDFEGDPCTRRRVKNEEGVLVAVVKYCWSFYRFDTTQETDSTNDYGVYWIQSTVAPRNGWCAEKVNTGLAMADSAVVHDKTLKDYEVRRAKTVTTSLDVDAETNATVAASVAKEFVVHRGTLNARWVAKIKNLKLVWSGGTRRKVAAAGGLEASWASDSGPPAFVPNVAPRMVSNC